MQNQLDQTAINLAKAIRQSETGGDYSAQGKSGESGGYQFTPDTWNDTAPKYGITTPLEQATPEQQNAVAYNRIKAWKDSGKDVTQIASMWNAGEGEPDAYTGKFGTTTATHKAGDPSVGVNSFGAKYDVPTYAKKVAEAYLTLKNGGQATQDSTNPSSTNNPENQTQKPQEETYGAILPASEGDESDNPALAGLIAGGKAIVNTPSSFLNLGKGLLNAVIHPIKTVEGIGNAAVGGIEKGYSAITGQEEPKNEQTQTFDSLATALKNRYGSLDALRKTATNDPAGFGADVMTIISGGGALADVALGTTGTDLARAAAEAGNDTFAQTGLKVMPKVGEGMVSGAINKGVTGVADAATYIPKKIVGGAVNLASEAGGTALGVGGGTLKGAVGAVSKGGDAYKSFVEGLSGNTSQEDLVNQARNALGEVVNTRQENYSKMLEDLGKNNTSLDISPINNEINKGLFSDRANGGMGIVKNPDGSLDFSRSTIRFNTSAQNDINKIYETMKTYGTQAGDRTPLGVDSLKQSFYGLDKPSSDVRAFTTKVSQATRKVLDNVSGYSDEMKNYGNMSDQIRDIQKGLSLGDNAMVETTFKKLTGAFKQNNEFRKALIQELDDATGGTLLPKIAGQQMSSWMPRGLMRTLEVGGLGMSAVTGGTGILPLLGTMMITSPKLVGELIRTLRLPASATNKVMELLSKVNPSAAVLGSNAENRVNPPMSALSNPQQSQ